jgi:hypothetical protein
MRSSVNKTQTESLRRFAALLVLTVVASGAFVYWPTFRASWAYDDMDYLNAAADVLAGKTGYWETVFRPHLEHLVPVVRMAFHASLALFGVEALPFRLANFLAHVGAAFFLGLVARRYGGAIAGYATGLAYTVPAGFSSMWVWLMTGAGVPFGLFGLTGGMAALAWSERLGPWRARLLAAAGALLALLSESTLAPLLAVPALLDEMERRRDGPARRPVGWFAVFCVVIMVAAMALASILYKQVSGGGFQLDLRRGVPRALFLLLVAPYRYVFPGSIMAVPGGQPRDVAVLGSLYGLAIAALAAGLVLALWRRGFPRRLGVAAALSLIGPMGVLGLVGLGRAGMSYQELWDQDRYFFTLFIPISLLVGAIAEGVRQAAEGRSRQWRAALALVVALGLGMQMVLHRWALSRRCPIHIFDEHEVRLRSLADLADRMAAAARELPPGSPPLEFPDANLGFPELHNGRVSARLLVHGLRGDRTPRLRLGGAQVGRRDQEILNPVLAGWARAAGEDPFLSIQDGRLVDARAVSQIDFRVAAHPERVVSGFHDHEAGYRWMGPQGVLRLRMVSVTLALEFGVPDPLVALGGEPAHLKVSLVDVRTGIPVELETLPLDQPGLYVPRVSTREFNNRFGMSRDVHLVLEVDRTWKPAEAMPGSSDTRDLSLLFFAAGFEGP